MAAVQKPSSSSSQSRTWAGTCGWEEHSRWAGGQKKSKLIASRQASKGWQLMLSWVLNSQQKQKREKDTQRERDRKEEIKKEERKKGRKKQEKEWKQGKWRNAELHESIPRRKTRLLAMVTDSEQWAFASFCHQVTGLYGPPFTAVIAQTSIRSKTRNPASEKVRHCQCRNWMLLGFLPIATRISLWVILVRSGCCVEKWLRKKHFWNVFHSLSLSLALMCKWHVRTIAQARTNMNGFTKIHQVFIL